MRRDVCKVLSFARTWLIAGGGRIGGRRLCEYVSKHTE